MSTDEWSFLNQPAAVVAPLLLGCRLERTVNGKRLIVKIVETEAYDQTDAASHSFKGQTARTDVMFGPAGFLYVYFTYGMHYCCNIVTDRPGAGSAVLIRAVEPIEGEDYIHAVRQKHGVESTNGPAKLCKALGIDAALNGHNLQNQPLKLLVQPPLHADQIGVSPRIGISKAVNVPWRFYIKNNQYISRRSS